jgi:hypothetical protein
VGTTNVGFRAPACLTFYCGAAREEAHCHTRQSPPIRTRLGSRNRSGDPSRGDHITNREHLERAGPGNVGREQSPPLALHQE